MQQEKINEKIINIESKKEVTTMNNDDIDNILNDVIDEKFLIDEDFLMNSPECTSEEDARKIIQDILKLPFKEWMAHYPEDYFSVVKSLAYGNPDLTDEQCSVKAFSTAEILDYMFDRMQNLYEDRIVITDAYMDNLAEYTNCIERPVQYYLRTRRHLSPMLKSTDASAKVDRLLDQLLSDVTIDMFNDVTGYDLYIPEFRTDYTPLENFTYFKFKYADNVYEYHNMLFTYNVLLTEALYKAAHNLIKNQ